MGQTYSLIEMEKNKMLGPLQLTVIGFDEPKYVKEIMLELKKLRKGKTIRLFDILYLIKDEEGIIDSAEMSDLKDEEKEEFGSLVKTVIGLSAAGDDHVGAEDARQALEDHDSVFGFSDSRLQTFADQLPAGSAAVFIIFEHVWARQVKEIIAENGGNLRAQGFIDPQSLKVAANELAAVIAAVNKSESAIMQEMVTAQKTAEAKEEEALQKAAAAEEKARSTEAAAAATMAAAMAMAKEAERVESEARAAQEEARLSAEAALAEAQAQVEAAEQEVAEARAEAEAQEEEVSQRVAQALAEAQEKEDEAFARVEAVRAAARRQEEMAEAAQAEAEAAIQQAEDMEAEAVLRAVHALVAANVIQKTAVREALDAIVSADVVAPDAIGKAASSESLSRRLAKSSYLG